MACYRANFAFTLADETTYLNTSLIQKNEIILSFTCRNAIKLYSSDPVSQVIRSKTYRGYVKPRIIPNAIYNVIFV
jgi:hypothetical protein